MGESEVTARPVRQWPLERPDLLILVSLAVVAVASVGLFVRAYRPIGPIDELQHIDYAAKVSRGDLVELGSKVGELAMREEACRGIDGDFVPPPCESRALRPEQFQEEGFNTAAAHPPLYYLMSGIGARSLTILGVDSFVTALRLTGGVWLAAGIIATWLLARLLGASRTAASVTSFGLIFTPLVLYTAATVNNDAPAIFVGATATLLTVAVVRERLAPVWLVGAGLLVTVFKATNLVVMGLCLGTLVLALLAPDISAAARRRLLKAIGWLVASAVSALAGWNVAVATLTIVPVADIPMTKRFVVEALDANHFLSQALAGVPPTSNAYRPQLLMRLEITLWTRLTDLAFVAATVAAALADSAARVTRIIGGLSLLGMVAVGPFFVLVNFVQFHTFVPIPSRYGMALLAPASAALAAVLRSRGSRLAAMAVVLFGALVVCAALVA